MRRPFQRFVAVGLTVCLLLISGVLSSQTVLHAVHHAHHKATTHASILCKWMCAAGQVLEGVTVHLQADLGPLAFVDLLVVTEPGSLVQPAPLSRGPPSFSV